MQFIISFLKSGLMFVGLITIYIILNFVYDINLLSPFEWFFDLIHWVKDGLDEVLYFAYNPPKEHSFAGGIVWYILFYCFVMQVYPTFKKLSDWLIEKWNDHSIQ